MNDVGITDVGTWLLDYGYDRIFRCWIKDSSENNVHFIMINEVFELPDGDIEIGFKDIYCWEDIENNEDLPIYYHKWSEIHIEYHKIDQVREGWN